MLISILNNSVIDSLNASVTLEPSRVNFTSYTVQMLNVLGKCLLKVSHEDKIIGLIFCSKL